jgi:hypothetical protein
MSRRFSGTVTDLMMELFEMSMSLAYLSSVGTLPMSLQEQMGITGGLGLSAKR